MATPQIEYDPAQRKCTVRGAAELPPEIFDRSDEIEILDASQGSMTSLPNNLGDLKNLRIAFFSDNQFTELPRVLADCPKLEMVGFKSCRITRVPPDSLPPGLRGLILTDNQIEALPDSIGNLLKLQKLMLTGNRLTSLPESFENLKNLELLRIPLNRLTAPPDWVAKLPKLAWYADAGNPFKTDAGKLDGSFRQIAWQDLEIGPQIGRSAKNEVYQARWDGRDVAVKLFGAGVTTDGSPEDEMNASLRAGEHPHIIGGLAKVTDAPDDREALVMPLIPQAYAPLGQPPDFTTLTRDVFPGGTSFTDEFITRVATDISEALRHLHERGIQHGDVYAHNILTRPDGSSYLGDLGAASVFEPGSEDGAVREMLDFRGFEYLLDDLRSKR